MWRSWSDGNLELAGSVVCRRGQRGGWRPTAGLPFQYGNRDSLNGFGTQLAGVFIKNLRDSWIK